MPELPEVETVVKGLAQVMEGRVLTNVKANRPNLRFPLPEGFTTKLSGKRVIRLSRRAKYGLIELEDESALLFHLGMSGRMRILPKDNPIFEKHDHIVFTTDDGTIIAFNDARRFGFMDIIAKGEAHPMLAKLGPEPLSNTFNGPELAARLKGRRSPIKSAILDQAVVAGVGNIYASEALYEAGISPKRSAHTVEGARAERLAGAIRAVLTRAIAAGGSSLKDYVRVDGELGYFQHQFRVYDNEGEACGNDGCGEPILRIVQSGRSTFFCGRCQR